MMEKKEVTCFILSAVVAIVHTLSISTPQKLVQVKKGDNATLPCSYQSSYEADIIAWMKMPDEVADPCPRAYPVQFNGSWMSSTGSGGSKASLPVFSRVNSQLNVQYFKSVHDYMEVEFINRYLDDGGTWIHNGYKGRVNFSSNTNNRDIGIILSQVTLNDNGSYECSVRIRDENPPFVHSAMELLVLVQPSKPDCKIIGITEYGQDINLTCHSTEGSPKPEYSWQSYDPENKQRALVGTVTSGVLMLKNISIDTPGHYICLSKNSVGESFCNITVNVTPPSMNFALLGGVIGGLVAAIIIIAVVAYCCCCRSAKEKDYEMTETENRPPSVRIRGPPEEEIQDEEEEEDRHHPVQPPISKVSPVV